MRNPSLILIFRKEPESEGLGGHNKRINVKQKEHIYKTLFYIYFFHILYIGL